MTEDNKPSWQYTPPSTPAAGDVIDATRFMKGAPRRGQDGNSSSSPVETQAANPAPQSNTTSMDNNPTQTPETAASSHVDHTASSTPSAYEADATPVAPLPEQEPYSSPMAYNKSPTPAPESNSGSIDYGMEKKPQATEYTTTPREGDRRDNRGFDRPQQRPYQGNNRREGFQGRGDRRPNNRYPSRPEGREPSNGYNPDGGARRDFRGHSFGNRPSAPAAQTQKKGITGWLVGKFKSLMNAMTGKKETASVEKADAPYSSGRRPDFRQNGNGYGDRRGPRRGDFRRGGRGGRGRFQNRGPRREG